MPSLRWVVPLSALGITSCSLLLDTGSLQGGSAHVDADASPPADAGSEGDAAQRSCATLLDCQDKNLDSCTRVVCGADHFCTAPAPYSGPAVDIAGDIETVLTASAIGYPTLLVDQSPDRADILLGVWVQNTAVTDIVVRKYDEKASVSTTSTSLAAALPNTFASFGSSPGLATPLLTHRLRLLFAGAPMATPAAVGMHQVDLDTGLKLAPTAQPKPDLMVAGYDTSPAGPVPRMIPVAAGEPRGMWVQQEKLYFFDGMNASEAFATKRVSGFAPLIGVGGAYAVLETSPLGAATGNEATEIWSQASTSLVGLVGDQQGARHGVTALNLNEGALVNLIAWSHQTKAGITLSSGAASCLGATCAATGAPAGQDGPLFPAVAPESDSARLAASTTDRLVIESFQLPMDTSDATSALVGTVATVSTQPQTNAISAKTMNPAAFVVSTVSGTATPPATFGPSSVAITSSGSILFAWVEHPGANRAVLKTRRYHTKTCP